jgi:hypothetical protein
VVALPQLSIQRNMSAYEADNAAEPTIASGSIPVMMTTQEAVENLELVTDGARRLLESSPDDYSRRTGRALARAVEWVRTMTIRKMP